MQSAANSRSYIPTLQALAAGAMSVPLVPQVSPPSWDWWRWRLLRPVDRRGRRRRLLGYLRAVHPREAVVAGRRAGTTVPPAMACAIATRRLIIGEDIFPPASGCGHVRRVPRQRRCPSAGRRRRTSSSKRGRPHHRRSGGLRRRRRTRRQNLVTSKSPDGRPFGHRGSLVSVSGLAMVRRVPRAGRVRTSSRDVKVVLGSRRRRAHIG